MKNRKVLVFVAALLCVAIASAPWAIAQRPNKPKATVTVQHPMPPKITELLKKAAMDAAGAAATGGVYKVPLNVAVGILQGEAHKRFGQWLAKLQICNEFKRMWAGCRPPMSGTINVEIVVDQGPPEIRVVVPFFAQLEGGDANNPTGYVAPIGPKGSPTMKLDVFGDGSLILERINCPTP